ncbi:DNA helicase RecQ [Paenibacillus aquistagni]|uniref:DNA helicase RecQ n=1 Tax=Paenibacillus aquistagni TaxID=1852522 RepID=A0A1X7JYE5_9BACL|nr:DNA helicase RecQ [Paenibacillus aquistagni]SMG33527.1 ATP-dependent DNA helicase RecQ [Paenibacillus aquistagni]
MAITMQDARQVLERVYGYEQFRDGQKLIIEHLIERKDTVGIMPTGGGKSICYQVPALLQHGLTLVISPLISLMKDQVDALTSLGVEAAYINSSQDTAEVNRILRRAQAGEIKLLYVAPERLESDWFLERAVSLRIAFLAVDEAHCVSQWGHDFRTSYRAIAPFVRKLAAHEFGERPLIAAFTATATPEVTEDIIRLLELQSPEKVITGFKRDNLAFTVLRGEDRSAFTLQYVKDRAHQSGIIYASTRREVENIHEQLVKSGIKAGRYHAGLSDEEREAMQEAFIYDDVRVIVATNAFGMGIDKSNVRYVLHYNMPKHMEAYVQEAGRAGRDGEPSECVLLFHPQDIVTQKFFIEQNETTPERKAHEYKKVQLMIDYCYTPECLQTYMLRYFGEHDDTPCMMCGNCKDEREQVDITIEAQKIFSCIYRMNQRFGVSMIASVLKGSKNKKVIQYGFDRLSTHGELRHMTEKAISDLIYVLIADGFLGLSEGQYPTVRLLAPAVEVIKGERKVQQKVAQSLKPKTLAAVDETLFEQLRVLRRELAAKEGVPPYIVFNDSTLRELTEKRPTTEAEFLKVKGVGEAKVRKFGEPFLRLFQQLEQVEAEQDEREAWY